MKQSAEEALLADSNITNQNIIKILKNKLNTLDANLSIRIIMLLDELITEYLEKHPKIDLFDLLVHLILIADRAPATIIADLLILVETKNCHLLETNTTSNAASFVRDHLKSEDIKLVLKNKTS